ncbi:MAG: hypothetical protein PHO08_16915 [Methylococcales bacterium]|nr:hypothetical protein [Methylococcales bacterium]
MLTNNRFPNLNDGLTNFATVRNKISLLPVRQGIKASGMQI